MSMNYLNNVETSEAVINLGVKKCNTLLRKTFILGIMGGLFVSLGYFGALVAMGGSADLPSGISKILGAMVFPVGLMIVVLVGGDLFTGNVLSTMAFIDRKITMMAVIKNLITVWFGNFVGAFLGAYFIYLTNSAGTDLTSVVVATAKYKLHLSNTEIIISGFFCNVLVALSIWATLASKDVVGKVFMMFFPVFLFVITGFQHCVANMFLFSYASFLDNSFNNLEILNAIFMATIGNFLSGGVFLPVIYYYLYVKKQN